MLKFIGRICILSAIAGLFVACTAGAIEYTKNFTFWSWHHAIAFAYLGTFLSVASLAYSLRKRRVFLYGPLGKWLNIHIVLGTAGLLLVLTHGRYQLRAMVPGLSVVSMLLVGLTGLFGWYLYLTKVRSLISEIKTLEEAEEYVLAKMAYSAFRFWRFIHILATFAALFFTIVHGISLVIFRGRY